MYLEWFWNTFYRLQYVAAFTRPTESRAHDNAETKEIEATWTTMFAAFAKATCATDVYQAIPFTFLDDTRPDHLFCPRLPPRAQKIRFMSKMDKDIREELCHMKHMYEKVSTQQTEVDNMTLAHDLCDMSLTWDQLPSKYGYASNTPVHVVHDTDDAGSLMHPLVYCLKYAPHASHWKFFLAEGSYILPILHDPLTTKTVVHLLFDTPQLVYELVDLLDYVYPLRDRGTGDFPKDWPPRNHVVPPDTRSDCIDHRFRGVRVLTDDDDDLATRTNPLSDMFARGDDFRPSRFFTNGISHTLYFEQDSDDSDPPRVKHTMPRDHHPPRGIEPTMFRGKHLPASDIAGIEVGLLRIVQDRKTLRSADGTTVADALHTPHRNKEGLLLMRLLHASAPLDVPPFTGHQVRRALVEHHVLMIRYEEFEYGCYKGPSFPFKNADIEHVCTHEYAADDVWRLCVWAQDHTPPSSALLTPLQFMRIYPVWSTADPTFCTSVVEEIWNHLTQHTFPSAEATKEAVLTVLDSIADLVRTSNVTVAVSMARAYLLSSKCLRAVYTRLCEAESRGNGSEHDATLKRRVIELSHVTRQPAFQRFARDHSVYAQIQSTVETLVHLTTRELNEPDAVYQDFTRKREHCLTCLRDAHRTDIADILRHPS